MKSLGSCQAYSELDLYGVYSASKQLKVAHAATEAFHRLISGFRKCGVNQREV